MADNPIKLTRGAGDFETTGTTTLDLTLIRSVNSRKSANLINMPMPTLDSSATIAFDLLGVTKEISINGQFVSGTVSTTNFTTDLDSLIFGKQGDTGTGQVGYTCEIPSKSGTFTVYVNDANWEYRGGDPNTIEYSVVLYEVSSSSG